jgi:RNA polymerase sigma-70 factor (ECF subfamily)
VLDSSNGITELLMRWRAGDEEALETLVPVVYNELRHLAHRYLQRERTGHTLQSTALVHEAYIRLNRQGASDFANRAHFFAISAQLMRQILVEYARGRKAVKRDGGHRLTLDEAGKWMNGKSIDLVALDDALNGLAQLDPRQGRIVELRFFAGLSIEETARLLDVSPATVKREWATARAWLRHEFKKKAAKA